MKQKFFISYILPLLLVITTIEGTYAASIYLDAPSRTGAKREPITVIVYLDNEGNRLSGVGGELTFRSDMFSIHSIIPGNSVIPLWVVPPAPSKERYLDGRIHIVFDGIIPGGFSGVRTGQSDGVYPGVLFIVNLIPKHEGITDLRLDEVEIRAFDEQATLVSNKGYTQRIFIPTLEEEKPQPQVPYAYVPSTSLTYTITSSEYIDNGKTFLFIKEENPNRLIEKIEYRESSEYSPHHIKENLWIEGSNPYIIKDQRRTTYIHAKVYYSDRTYATLSIPPVENFTKEREISRILVYIVIVVSLLYHYGKHYFQVLRTKRGKRT